MQSSWKPWLLVGALWVVALLNYLDRQVVFSLFPLLEKDLNASSIQLGLTGTVFLWVYGILSPFAGYLADRFGRRRIIVASLITWSVVTLLTGFVRNIEEMLLTRALMGISEACYLPAALALIVEAHPRRTRALATGLHQSGLYTGMILGGVWGGWMGDHYGWRPVFLLLGAAGVAYFFLLLAALRRIPDSGAEQARLNFFETLLRLGRTRGFLSLTAVFAGLSVANWLVYTWLPVFLFERFHLSLTSAGFSATFYIQMASYLGILAGGWVSDRWVAVSPRGRIFTQVAGLLISAPFLFLVGVVTWFPLLIAALVSFGLGRGLYDCNTMPVLSQIAPDKWRSTGYGIFNLAGCLVGGFTAAFGGLMKQTLGLSIAFQSAAVILFLSALLLLVVRPAVREN